MHEFDPRRPAFRIAPRVLMGLAGVCVVALGLRLQSAEASLPGASLKAADAAHMAALQQAAFAESEIQPGLAAPQVVDVEIQSGETFVGALTRQGVSAGDAQDVVDLLGRTYDTVKIRAGLRFQAAIAHAADGDEARLIGLSMRTGPATQLTIARSYDGVLRLREMTEPLQEETTIVQGDIDGSLYEAAGSLGATSAITNQAVRLFSHKIDFSRDIHPGDQFKLVFTRKVSESGRTIEGLNLLYAEIDARSLGGKPMRFYRYENDKGEAEYYDETGRSTRGFLMQTPVGFSRVTSTFGYRKHPVLGYTAMHQGIDFAGATGTPIYASGDGVVAEARRNGGYGNWVRISHGNGWDTGYAHMSRFAAGIHAGVHVRQGQLIGYVGATGRVTGPHLHYEVMHNGVKMNPRSTKVPAGGSQLTGDKLVAFKTEVGQLDATLAQADKPGQTRLASTPAQEARTNLIEVRPQQISLRE